MLKKILLFFKNETVLTIAWFFAVLSMFFTAPSAAYAGYINFEVLAVLFCLMAVVAGFIKSGLFYTLSGLLLAKTARANHIALILMLFCFFSSMLITNDVALITFVPLAISLLGQCGHKRLIFVIVMLTIAANLGSMLTPVGNPQNLYLYSFYRMELADFLRTTAPYCAAALVLLVILILVYPDTAVERPAPAGGQKTGGKRLLVHLFLFLLALAVVLRRCDYRLCLAVTVAVLLIADRGVLAKIDYSLLAVFVAFFIFVGNLAQIPAVKAGLAAFMQGREFFTVIAASQIISNVPAAVMFSGFTQNAKALLLGADLGGLGTLVASLASLISFKYYSKTPGAQPLRFLAVFTAYNLLFLALLGGIWYVISGGFA